ncbi:rhodanese-like domain-containing protein [Salipaludibacillus sp. HK11]|uniref:rhodanese-like domain-containing protein n=1 Tax=Salipaludibacillus sp. HK11 TaxID=3394320 RepID=UPI0039FB92DA
MKKLTFLLVLLLGIVLVGCSNNDANTGNMNEMSSEDLQTHLEEDGMDEETYYIDVREEDEFAESHVAGFINIPMDDVIEDASILPEDQEILILCNTQNRSIQVGEAMIEQGFDASDISIVMGGIASYEGEKVE